MNQIIQNRTQPAVLGGICSLQSGFVTGWVYDTASPLETRRVVATVGDQTREYITGYDPVAFGMKGAPATSGFLIPIPVRDREQTVRLQILDGATRTLIYAGPIHQQPLAHPNGNLAFDIQRLQKRPLAKMQYFAFDGDTLKLHGFAQSAFDGPGGDRSDIAVQVRGATDVNVNRYLLPPDGHDVVFWYLPGAQYSGISIEIDLAGVAPRLHEIEFSVSAGSAQHPVDVLANTTWWPSRLEHYCPYPTLDRLQRVHVSEDRKSVAMSGYSDARRLRRLYQHYVGDLAGRSILDWGCGHGRVIRHFAIDGDVSCAGVDIDPDNVDWAQRTLAGVDWAQAGLHPPMPFPSDSFDFVYGISVMTHLMPDNQAAWLTELARVTRRDGLCILTFAGDTSVAYTSQFLGPDWISEYRAQGWNGVSYDNFTAPVEPGYYRNVHQTIAHIREKWGAFFEILDIRECVFGYQDIAVLRNVKP
jgi:SAM-dependent methyltransferase